MITLLRHPATPTVRLLPAPRCEPPTDAELAAAGGPAPPPAAPPLPLDVGGAQRSPCERPPPVAPPAYPGTSAARVATRRFLAICLEIIGGFRPVAHLRPLCVADRYADIAAGLRIAPGTPTAPGSTSAAARAARGGGRRSTGRSTRDGAAVEGVLVARVPPGGRPSGGGTGRDARSGHAVPARVDLRRVQICEPIDGVAEVAVVLARRDQVWAMALRLEQRAGVWLCTHLEVL